jgi:hypothetical protein
MRTQAINRHLTLRKNLLVVMLRHLDGAVANEFGDCPKASPIMISLPVKV